MNKEEKEFLDSIKFMFFQKYDNSDRGIMTIYWQDKGKGKSTVECDYEVFKNLKNKAEKNRVTNNG